MPTHPKSEYPYAVSYTRKSSGKRVTDYYATKNGAERAKDALKAQGLVKNISLRKR